MATLHSVEQRFLQKQTNHTQMVGQKIQLEKQIADAREEAAINRQKQKLYTHTQELLLRASATARTLAQQKIEELVTLALTGITGEPYQFKMDLVQLSGSWTVKFQVINPAGVALDPIDNCGGGIADICSMALRVAILEMYEPRVEGPIMFDENFKYLSRDHIRTTAEWLHMLSEKTGRQIILVTHVPELAAAATACFEVLPQGETSIITDITNEGQDV